MSSDFGTTEFWTKAQQLFAVGEYWECHEVLEEVWLESDGLHKEFYAGVILCAAALHKARVMESPRGGRRNYAKAMKHLALVPDIFHDTQVRELEALVHQALRDESLFPKIPIVKDSNR